MKSTNRKFKNFIQWILAAIVAFVFANVLILPYWYAPGWVSRDSGATPAIYHAGKTVINGYEGYGWASVDQRGYLNEDKPLAEEVILVLGCSHTKGIEVAMDKRYTSLLNEKISGGDDSKLYVYNMAIDGFYFPQIADGFKAALQEIPSVSTVIIEMPSTEYAPTDFTGFASREYSVDSTGTTAFVSQPLSSVLQTSMKEIFPLTSLYLSKQFVSGDAKTTPFFQANAGLHDEFIFPPAAYEEYMQATEQAFQAIREVWSGELIVLYHPSVQINQDGTISYTDTISLPWFYEANQKFNVAFAGMGGIWHEAYNSDKIIPYGFSNTAPAQGHLNEDGHRLIAELLYTILEGGNNQ